VLVEAVQEGTGLLTWDKDSFAYADDYDEGTRRYRGLRVAQRVPVSDQDPRGLLVKPEVALKQLEAEASPGIREPAGTAAGRGAAAVANPGGPGQGLEAPAPEKAVPTRFHGTVVLDPVRVGAEAGRVAEEVITHLVNVPGARVEVTLEIEATAPEGIPEDVRRTVTENARTLKFKSHGFEQE
ncbi:MAG: AAA+ family ATPase, partial [Armatimonadetes bacterium]|nr:AAA+ family ATPase [Armatimonadota bacterium]MDW8154509.1 AAA+ family ATPase [Armatimonadota bacterium]